MGAGVVASEVIETLHSSFKSMLKAVVFPSSHTLDLKKSLVNVRLYR